MQKVKTCTKCKKELPISKFSLRNKKTDRNYRSHCKDYLNIEGAERRNKNKEAISQQKKEYYQTMKGLNKCKEDCFNCKFDDCIL